VKAYGSAAFLGCIGVALVLGAAARSAAGPAPSFAAGKSYATGQGPRQPVITDLNGDGKPELVTADFLRARVSVLLNRGDGRFARRQDYATTKYPVAVEAADLNADGAPDLVGWTSNPLPPNTVSVLLNRGDGSFEPRRDYAIAAGDLAVAIADLNGDDKPDLATATPNTVSVLLNRGDGSFESRRDYANAGGGVVAPLPHVEPVDLNGDGRRELVSWTTSRDPIGGSPTVSVFLNRGDGSFEPSHDYETGELASLTITDLNGDDRPDLATATLSSHVSVFLNRGDGTFEPRRDYATSGYSHSLAATDLNGDGRLDIVVAASGISVLLNNGDGSFGSRRDYRGCSRCGATAEVAIGDLNGDGKPDVAAEMDDQAAPGPGRCLESLSEFLNLGNGTFGPQHSWFVGLGQCGYLPRLSDLNGDGTPDLLHGSAVRLNRGDGGFGRRLLYPARP
jgi:hypothetical protein